MFKYIFGEIFNIFTHFKAPIKDLFKILFQNVWQKKTADSSKIQEKN